MLALNLACCPLRLTAWVVPVTSARVLHLNVSHSLQCAAAKFFLCSQKWPGVVFGTVSPLLLTFMGKLVPVKDLSCCCCSLRAPLLLWALPCTLSKYLHCLYLPFT